jgi:capsular polysaccharide biosynthesis protein
MFERLTHSAKTSRMSRPLRLRLERARIAHHRATDSVLQWALANGAPVERIRPPVTVNRPPPKYPQRTHPEFFNSLPPSYLVGEKYLVLVAGGRLVGEDGLLVLPDGSFSVESVYDRPQLDLESAFHRPLPRRERVHRGNYYSLVIKFGSDSNYYHWLHDVVIRLHDIVERLPPDTLFVVPPGRREFQDEALAIAGVAHARLWEFDGSGVERFENLYFSPPSALTRQDSPDAEIWFRDRALRRYGLSLGPASRRIYITRREARHRRIANEAEVEEVLHGYGFETHLMEGYSLAEQVTLFSKAEIVVSPHGAGLANILFSPPELTVVDIFEPSRFSKSFWSMSGALSHRYWCLIGDTVPSGTSYAGDIHVPLGDLKEILDATTTNVRR